MSACSFIKNLWQPILRELSKSVDKTKFNEDYCPVHFKLLKVNFSNSKEKNY